MAIASILHRISGFVLFLLIPVVLWLLGFSLTSDGFDVIQQWLDCGVVKCLVWVLLLPFCYHLVAGIRHLLSDIHIGNTRTRSKQAALAVFITFALLALFLGIWLW